MKNMKTERLVVLETVEDIKNYFAMLKAEGIPQSYSMATIKSLTVEIAEYLLDIFVDNRKLRKATMKALEEHAKNGNLKSIGSPIRANCDLRICDGGHRIMNVILTGEPYPEVPLIVLGDPEAPTFIDNDRAVRSPRDTQKMTGRTESQNPAIAAIHYEAINFRDNAGNRLSVAQKVALMDRSRAEEAFYIDVYNAWRATTGAGRRGAKHSNLIRGVGGGMIRCFKTHPVLARKFFMAAARNNHFIDDEYCPMVRVMNNFLIAAVEGHKTETEHADAVDRKAAWTLIRIWNEWRRGKVIKSWRRLKVDHCPEVL